jgi:SAM-dependent methyltransferase
VSRRGEAVVWHDVECGAYAADLPLWRELADEAGGPVLDVGAGTGRVTLDLARRGHAVTALDRDGELLAELEARAAAMEVGGRVRTVAADARELSLPERFALCLAPMQFVQLLDAPGRRAFLRRAREHLRPAGLFAAAISPELERFGGEAASDLPLPDIREVDGWVYASQPVALRVQDGIATVERRRQLVSPAGERREERDVVRLHDLDADTLVREATEQGFEPLPPRTIAPTDEHVGSVVVALHAAC